MSYSDELVILKSTNLINMEEIVDFDITHTSHRQVFSVLQLTITCDSLLQSTSTDDSDVTGLIRTGSVCLMNI